MTAEQPKKVTQVRSVVFGLTVLLVSNLCWALSFFYPTFSSPVLHGDTLIVCQAWDSDVLCLEKRTGNLLWRTSLDDKIASGPWSGSCDADEVVVAGWEQVFVLDAVSGKILRRFPIRACMIGMHGADLLYYTDCKVGNTLHCINLRSGKELWSWERDVKNLDAGFRLCGDFVFVVTAPMSFPGKWGPLQGDLPPGFDAFCLRACDGAVMWREQDRPMEHGAGTTWCTAKEIDRFLLLTESNTIRLLDKKSGAQARTLRMPGTVLDADAWHAERLVTCSRQSPRSRTVTIQIHSMDSLEQCRQFDLSQQGVSRIDVMGDTLVVHSLYSVKGIHLTTQKEIWSSSCYKTTLAGDRIYFGAPEFDSDGDVAGRVVGTLEPALGTRSILFREPLTRTTPSGRCDQKGSKSDGQ